MDHGSVPIDEVADQVRYSIRMSATETVLELHAAVWEFLAGYMYSEIYVLWYSHAWLDGMRI